MKGIIMKAFHVNYCPKGGGDVQQILVIARDLTQALNAVTIEITERNQIIELRMVEGKTLICWDEER